MPVPHPRYPTASESFEPTDEVQAVLARLIERALPIGIGLGALAVAASMVRALHSGWRPIFSLHVALVAGITLLFFARRRLSRGALVGVLLSLAAVDGVANMLTFGLATNGLLVLGCICVFASLAFGRRAGLLALTVAVLLWSAVALVVTSGVWTLSAGVDEQLFSGWSWVSQIAAAALFVFMTLTATHAVQQRLLSAVRAVSGRTLELERANLALRHEIAQREKAEAELAQRDQTFRLLAEQLTDVMFVQDMTLALLYVSPSVSKVMGYTPEEVKALGMAGFMTPESLRKAIHEYGGYVEKAMAGQVHVPLMEYEYIRKDGGRLWGELRVTFMRGPDGALTGSQGILRDITDRKRADQERAGSEAQSRQADKMRAIGQLAGGIAHDFNNQLTGILMGSELIARELRPRPDLLRYVEFIRTSAGRAAELTVKLLAFSRKDQLLSAPTDMHGIIAEVIAILERSVEKTIVLRQDLRAERSVVMADAAQLQSALLNVALNARDAMDSGGAIEFRSETVHFATSKRFSAGLEIDPGDYLHIQVRDTGAGMDEPTRARAFEPFFTTKSKEKGTGLGLATVYGAVQGHRGSIDLQSTPGHGTAFSIYLPLPADRPIASSQPAMAAATHGQGHVLLVEDEPVVRESVKEMLEHAGYDVDTCDDGDEAVGEFRRGKRAFDAVVLDLVLPKRSGRDVFLALREIEPHMPVVVISGYSKEGEAGELARQPATAFVPKPFTSEALTGELARLLQGRTRLSDAP